MLYNHLARRINVMLTVAENNSRTLRMEIERSHASMTKTAGKPADGDSGLGMHGSNDISIEEVAEELETVMAE